MTPELWGKVDRIWHAVLERPKAERARAIDELCAGDAALHREVTSLFVHLSDASAAGFGAPPPPMRSIAKGTRLGPYVVDASIGAGGMGEVYRARDHRLARDVAIKVLPPEVGNDPSRLRQFEEEARAAAALNHPNILAVYDVGSQPADGPNEPAVSFIVTELLEGRTLRELLRDERLPVSRMLALARQIVNGLAAAHARGIVHRDLKPENLFVTADGHVKILDFGLARAIAPGGHPDQSETTHAATSPHLVVGTPGYMAPEQVRGQTPDHRGDIFAFGAVLYEMLTGRRAFHGDTPLDALSAVLRDPPSGPISTPERPVPPSLVRIVERCLEKLPGGRFQSTVDLAFALEGLTPADSGFVEPADRAADDPTARRRFSWSTALPWALAAAAAAAFLTVWHPWRNDSSPPPPEQWAMVTPGDVLFAQTSATPTPAISPDGAYVVLVVKKPDGGNELWLRSNGNGAGRRLPGTDGPELPFWKPDSTAIGFGGDNALKRFDLATNKVRTICALPANLQGATWAPDDTIVFATPKNIQGLQRVPADGSANPVTITTPNTAAGEDRHRQPSMLPDGRHVLFQAISKNVASIAVASLDGSPHQNLGIRTDSHVEYVPSGYLLYVVNARLLARKFDLAALRPVGEPATIVDSVSTHSTTGRSAFTVSRTGTLVYRGDRQVGNQVPAWFDRATGTLTPIGTTQGYYVGVELSPSGTLLLTHEHDPIDDGSGPNWIINLESGRRTQVTFGVHHDEPGLISPDGKEIQWFRKDAAALFRRPADGTRDERQFFKPAVIWSSLTDWTSRWLVGTRADDQRTAIVYTDAAKPGKDEIYLTSDGRVENPRLSTDEKWIAYAVEERDGSSAIYIQAFPDAAGAKWKVPGSENAHNLRWRRDGGEIFFPLGGMTSRSIQAVEVRTGTPSDPFGVQRKHQIPEAIFAKGFAVSPDAARFLVMVPNKDSTPEVGSLTVLLNWEPRPR
jgi:serine/threonine protein kinase